MGARESEVSVTSHPFKITNFDSIVGVALGISNPHQVRKPRSNAHHGTIG